MIEKIPSLDKKGLRNFGLTMGGFIGGLFGLLLPWLLSRPFLAWPWILAGIFWLWAFVIPNTLQRPYFVWVRIGNVLGWINTRIILGFMFYLVFLPMGIGMRLFGKDPMNRKMDRNLSTYRIQSKNTPKNQMERPF